jgi:hypothetical protein
MTTFNPTPDRPYAEQAREHNANAAARRKSMSEAEMSDAAAAQAPIPAPVPPPNARTAAQRRTGSAAVHRRRLVERDAARRDWQITLEADELLEEAMTPPFFGLSADRLRPGDRIVVLGHQLAFWCELIVMRSDDILRMVWVSVLHPRVDLDVQAAFDLSQYVIEQSGADWRILHGRQAIVTGLPSKIAAERWLERRMTAGLHG